ncbi:MAG: DNA/RNA non-specific endonuclease [Monoglobaceae bacterium]
MKKLYSLLSLFVLMISVLTGCVTTENLSNQSTTSVLTEIVETSTLPDQTTTQNTLIEQNSQPQTPEISIPSFDLSSIPGYSGSPYIAVNGNNPYFTESDYTTAAFENYSPLDSMGRCGVAFANVCLDIMPTEDRGNIGNIKPSGWQTIRYENVDGKYLYNRCHLIGFQLAGENDNELNLITGTRYMNVDGMLPFENMVDDYVEETGNHVLFRVTPIFEGSNLVASGVLMEGWSVEDHGDGICFNVYCYNVQPGIKINYANGDSESEDGSAPYGSSAVVTTQKKETAPQTNSNTTTYIGNKNSKKFHYPYCHSVDQMNDSNKKYMTCTREQAIAQGYSPCGNCNP